MSPLNQCCTCDEDFASLAAFDQHVLSKPSDPTFDCLSVAELRAQGWVQDERGRWTSPKLAANADKLRQHFKREAA
jgi:hypothetical protein